MTETEWRMCPDPIAMLIDLRGRASDRKFRLFACACARRVEDWTERRFEADAVAVAERMADGLASSREIEGARAAFPADDRSAAGWWQMPALDEDAYAAATRASQMAWQAAEWAHSYDESRKRQRIAAARPRAVKYHTAREEDAAVTTVVREVFGNPFLPAPFDPRWRTTDVTGVARGMYDDRAFDRFPILTDALLDAGCDSEMVLAHCRGTGPHVRGCWVIDLVLGRA